MLERAASPRSSTAPNRSPKRTTTSIVDRLAGVAAFRRAVDMQAEWLKNFPDSPRREEIESAAACSISIRCAPTMRRASAPTRSSKEHPDSAETGMTSSSRSSGSTCARDAPPTSRSAAARSWAARLPAHSQRSPGRRAAARGISRQHRAARKSARCLQRALQDDADAQRSRRRAVADGDRVASRRQSRARGQRAAAGAAAEARFRNRACRLVLARIRAGCRRLEGGSASAVGSLAQRHPFTYYGARAAVRSGAPPPAASMPFPSSRCAMRSSLIPTTRRPRCFRAPACCRRPLSTRGG